MAIYEINALMRNAHYRNKDDWEQARLIAYLVAQTNSTKKLKLSDIIEFPWEKPEIKHETITQEEIDELEIMAESMKQFL